MNCRDVRDMADAVLHDATYAEQSGDEIQRHLETCRSCRAEVGARRRLQRSLHTAFERSADLQPSREFVARLREQLRERAVDEPPRRTMASRWLALAASVALAIGLSGVVFLNRSTGAVDTLAQDAIGDHENCALKFRLVRAPIPLEEAAQRFDNAYRLLLSAPPNEISAPGGLAQVVERHSCVYQARRFGHVILRYRGRAVSLLVTANDAAPAAAAAAAEEWAPHLIGNSVSGLSVVSVRGPDHSVLLVSDLSPRELTELSNAVSVPLAEQLQSERKLAASDKVALLSSDALWGICLRPNGWAPGPSAPQTN
jgi:hypothetical protein